ncbi:efflux RND transporter periplasmic adaptor subunit [Bacillus sp. WLY-B-L8]|uniref:efflux RND transporter periplasmic adaptor subunit n=1 Tax=Bacillus multifaciens TaxID=3068506 RepID=UPI0027422514|nr:efflux RND transporter periplasmic adaptor subunit [Bacillus sp. WLY-B-L8]MDP7978759.1 efflux RND transporter periplasmic adaptor subunit [Bacillus sp. WLY-B-L8]
MKKKTKLLIVGLATIGIGAGSYFALAGGSTPAMAYSGYKVTEKKIENAQKFGGEVIPNGIETIAFDPTKGNYELAVKKGDQVKKGQLLLKYNNSSIKLEKSEAEMQKKLAEKEVALLQKQVDAAKQKLQTAKQSGAAGDMLKAAEQEVQAQETQLEMKKLEVEKAKQMMQNIQEKENALSATSPVDGTIEDINKGTEEKAAMSGITIRTAGPLKVKGQLSEYELSQMKVGQEVSVTSKTVPGKTWTGKVTEIGTAPVKNADENKTVSNYPFVITLDNNDDLQPGFHVYVTAKSGEANGTVVPKSSIVKKGDKNVVFVVKDGKAKEQAITIEFQTDSEAKVSGLKTGEQVISKPEKDLQDGMEVNMK